MQGRHPRPETHLSPPAAPHRRKSLKMKPIRRPCSDLYPPLPMLPHGLPRLLRHGYPQTQFATYGRSCFPYGREPPETTRSPHHTRNTDSSQGLSCGIRSAGMPSKHTTRAAQHTRLPASSSPDLPCPSTPLRPLRATAVRHPISSRPPCVDIALYNRYRKFTQNFSTLYCIIQIKLSIFALSNNKQNKHNKFP